ncbi:Helix-turn-helix domain-containing protein [Amycolatopsis tolypomycina]|uniref:Helix-turn-helix domain-containing protein n=1 Tax=Amycolatopsis tolypomycina TaxID=208445 RepID=A0A1H4Z9J1_9PSEU|nr:helix-turn-helix transcriptional regulator [Amycolatopsis tolypomycina]SED26829.1 Helix-turn-helix domain-containing protein [Amycolatopsis tolypomycina]
MQTPTRRCEKCGARLARDRVSNHCGPCIRLLIAHEAPPQPDTFWAADSIRAALKDRHFGRLFAAYRKESNPHVSQAALGRWLGLTQAQVSRLEAPGARPPSNLVNLERWAKALQVPPALLWFSVSHTVNELAGSGDDISLGRVQRRQFFRTAGVGATAIGASLLGAGPAVAASPPKPRSTDVEIVRDMTATFRRLDNRFGGGHSRATTTITNYLTSTVAPMLKDTTRKAAAREELLGAAAELHQVAGWIAFDVGNAAEGQRRLRDALKLSQDAGDDALEAEMLAAMSHHAAFNGAPEVAVDMALAARRTAKRSGLAALQAEAAVLEAHGHALQANSSACFAALHEAERAFERFSPGSGPAWLNYFDSAYLSAKFAHVFRDLGSAPEAEQFARRALGMDDGYERGRLFNTALLASTLADQGRVDEACVEATAAVRMSEQVRSIRGGAYLADVGRRLSPYRGDRRVRALYTQMDAAGVPTPIQR